MDFGERKTVSLRGSKKSAPKSRAEVLAEARARRQKREETERPVLAATAVQKRTRGFLQRRRLGRTLRAALTAAIDAGDAASTVEVRLTLLFKVDAWRDGDEVAAEHALARLLADPPAPPSVESDAWRLRCARLLPIACAAAGAGGAAATALLVRLCGAEGGSMHRTVLTDAATPLFRALARRLAADDTDDISGLVALGRAAAGADDARPDPQRLASFVETLRPPFLLSRPPARRAALAALLTGWRLEARSRLLEALAPSLGAWSRAHQIDLAGGAHEAAAMVLESLEVLLDGGGLDWRAGGWAGGRPRLTTEAELGAVMDTQLEQWSRQLGLNAADALLLLLRNKWDAAAAAAAAEPAATDGVSHQQPRPTLPSDAHVEGRKHRGLLHPQHRPCRVRRAPLLPPEHARWHHHNGLPRRHQRTAGECAGEGVA